MGGKEPPCQPASLLRQIEKETGYPCPRRESLNADDDLCLDLLFLMISPRLAALAGTWAELLLAGLDADHRLQLLRRVAAAFADDRIAKMVPIVPRLF